MCDVRCKWGFSKMYDVRREMYDVNGAFQECTMYDVRCTMWTKDLFYARLIGSKCY
jgi:hypothetical protein